MTQSSGDVSHIRRWLQQQPHLPPVTDEKILLFLHSCNYSLERTKTTIDTYYALKASTPEFFSQRIPDNEELRNIQKVVQISPLPKKTPDGYRVIFGRLLDNDPNQFLLDSAIKYLFMVIDATLKEDGVIPGFVITYDMTGISFGHLTRINLMSVKKYFTYIQLAIPIRLKGIHIINVNPVMTSIMNLIKPFMEKEHMSLLHLHTDKLEEFYQYVPQELLPKDYKGEMSSSDALNSETIKRLESIKAWFHEEEKFKADESKRDCKTSMIKNVYSTTGSFKKLDID